MNTSELVISFINMITNASLDLKDAMDMINPSDNTSSFIDIQDEVLTKLKRVSRIYRLASDQIKGISNYYDSLIGSFSNARLMMLEEVDQRKQKQIQMNTMATLYDEDNLIAEIQISLEDSYEIAISNVTTTTLTDAKDYSAYALVSRLENDDETLSKLYRIIHTVLEEMSCRLIKFNDDLMHTIASMEDASTIDLLCSNSDEAKECIIKCVNWLDRQAYTIDSVKKGISRIFQICNELEHNYEVYQSAVKTYTSFALESFFNTYSNYEL